MVIFENTLSNLIKRRDQALKLYQTFENNIVMVKKYMTEIKNVEKKTDDIERTKTKTRNACDTFETPVSKNWTSTFLNNLLPKQSPDETRDLTVETNQKPKAALYALDSSSIVSDHTARLLK